MKVAFFIGSLNRGGTETLVLDSFRKRDVAPFESILLYRNEGDLSGEYRTTGVKMVQMKPQGRKTGYIHQLRKTLKQEKVDILHTQTLLNAFLGLFCVCFTHMKLVATFHGFYLSIKDRLITHLVMWFADAVIFVSDYQRRWYLNNVPFCNGKRCHVVYNGVDFSKFDKEYHTPDFIQEVAPVSSGDVVKLAMVGSFVSGRSQSFLCCCLKRLRDDGVGGFQFYFVGKRSEAEPDRYDQCVRYCRENGLLDIVHFVGGRSDVPAILQHIDGFVYSTVDDTFGIAVVEAMASGIPVIVNDWDVMKEITFGGRWATLYKTNDEEDCVSKITALVCGGRHRGKNGPDTAKSVREYFSIEKHIQNLYSVYCVS